jgi:hypothetical protein
MIGSPVKFGGLFYLNLRVGVIVSVSAIGLARFSAALGLACGYRVPRREGLIPVPVPGERLADTIVPPVAPVIMQSTHEIPLGRHVGTRNRE